MLAVRRAGKNAEAWPVTASYDFSNTVKVDRLEVPIGHHAVGENGLALPFDVVPVPEPTAGVSIGLLFLATLARRRRKRVVASLDILTDR